MSDFSFPNCLWPSAHSTLWALWQRSSLQSPQPPSSPCSPNSFSTRPLCCRNSLLIMCWTRRASLRKRTKGMIKTGMTQERGLLDLPGIFDDFREKTRLVSERSLHWRPFAEQQSRRCAEPCNQPSTSSPTPCRPVSPVSLPNSSGGLPRPTHRMHLSPGFLKE